MVDPRTKAQQPVGTRTKNQNGYWNIKTEEGKWRLEHHVVAEKKLGRPLKKGERVSFADGDRENLDPSNLRVMQTYAGSDAKRLAKLRSDFEIIKAEIAELETRLKSS
jgi:beta-galactosidase GanA